ncbi:MAG: baseplate J/gp47 family protein [Anaerolineales bacterium]|nr:baseplate J/gp47 family protein [Anaerolineales bacterium]
MKTHILQLESHDDVISVRDKMGWAKTGRILLVWPERGRVLYRRLDLALLQRHCAALGAQLALVSRDPEVRYHAPRLGIPVFKSLRRAQSSPWRLPRRFRLAGDQANLGGLRALLQADSKARPRQLPPRPGVGRSRLTPLARLVFFALGVLALLSIAATLLPSARLRLTPRRQVQEVVIQVQAEPAAQEVRLSGVVPARLVSVVVEGRDSLPVSGSIQLPDRSAIGHVLFTNLTDQPVNVPEGTVVRGLEPGSLRFAVTQAGVVPGGPGESLSLPVRSLIPGSQGNLPAGSLVAIEGLLGTQLGVFNPLPAAHGTDRQEPAPSQQDRSQLSEQLRSALQVTALNELEESLTGDDLLIPSSLRLANTLQEVYEPADAQPADLLELGLQMEYQALIVLGDDLYGLAEVVLDANLPPGYAPVGGDLEVVSLDTPVLGSDGIARWKLHARRRIQAQLPEPEAIRVSMGLDPDLAAERLQAALPLDAPAEILLEPAWWPRLPILPFRITVDTQ